MGYVAGAVTSRKMRIWRKQGHRFVPPTTVLLFFNGTANKADFASFLQMSAQTAAAPAAHPVRICCGEAAAVLNKLWEDKIPLGQYRIILSADTASEVRQMLSQKRR